MLEVGPGYQNPLVCIVANRVKGLGLRFKVLSGNALGIRAWDVGLESAAFLRAAPRIMGLLQGPKKLPTSF